MTAERIYLVGFMGAGKSRVGRVLASRLGWTFMDLDAVIEKKENMAVRDIFLKSGEAHFRRVERKCLQTVSSNSNAVIALGGGAYIDPDNRRLADSTGTTVWLEVAFASVVRRVTMDGTRPLFADREESERLFLRRQPLYRLARIHVLTDNREPEAVADEILQRLEQL